MRFVKVAAAATSLLVLGAATSIGSAGAAATGVGTSRASTTVVGVSLGTNGSLLDVRLIGDDAQSTIDSKTAAAPEAFSKLTALRATSAIVDDPTTSQPLDLTLSALESRQPGGQAEVTQSSLDLANPGISVLPGLGDIISGNLNLAKLTSAVDASSAKSSVTGSLTNTKVAGALLDAQAVGNTLASSSTATESTSTRAVNVDAITVLDLGALLSGLDINLADLTPAELSALLESLGVTLPNVDPATTLNDLVDDIQAELVTLAGLIASETGIDGSAGDIIADLGLEGLIPDTVIDAIDGEATAIDQANALVDALQAALVDVLNTALSALDSTSLLKLDGVDVGVTTKAADTVENSSATLTGKIGAITVGNLTLVPEIDVLEVASAINAKVDEVNSAIGGVLDTVGSVAELPVSLEDLVDVKVLQPTGPSVETVNGYVTATAGITGLTATITPPADLADLVAAIKAQTTVAGSSAAALIEGYEGELAALSDAMDDLEATLGEGVTALQGGATVNLAQVMGVSEFRSVAPPVDDTDPPLAATGNNSVRLAAVGFLLLAMGLGLGRWFRMPVPVWVRRRF